MAIDRNAVGAKPPRLLIVAGEASGDVHGASLVAALRLAAPGIEVVAVGGDRMRDQGAQLLAHYRDLAVVGVTEVVAHLGAVRRVMRDLLQTVMRGGIDGVVLIDYPDFNMTLARRLRRAHPQLPIVYYISPQVWAWRRRRARALARLADLMLVILPFERQLYEQVGMPVRFVGHPLLDALPARRSRAELADRFHLQPDREWIGLFPGSRRAEVRRLLPVMVGAAEQLQRGRTREFLIPRAGALGADLYERILSRVGEPLRARLHLLEASTFELASECRAAVVCSGTATLETALAGTPQVVVYRTSWLTYNLGKLLVRIPDIALVNVVAGQRGVPELLQRAVTPERIARELGPLLDDSERRDACRAFLIGVRDKLGGPGASARAADAVLQTVAASAPTTAMTAR